MYLVIYIYSPNQKVRQNNCILERCDEIIQFYDYCSAVVFQAEAVLFVVCDLGFSYPESLTSINLSLG